MAKVYSLKDQTSGGSFSEEISLQSFLKELECDFKQNKTLAGAFLERQMLSMVFKFALVFASIFPFLIFFERGGDGESFEYDIRKILTTGLLLSFVLILVVPDNTDRKNAEDDLLTQKLSLRFLETFTHEVQKFFPRDAVFTREKLYDLFDGAVKALSAQKPKVKSVELVVAKLINLKFVKDWVSVEKTRLQQLQLKRQLSKSASRPIQGEPRPFSLTTSAHQEDVKKKEKAAFDAAQKMLGLGKFLYDSWSQNPIEGNLSFVKDSLRDFICKFDSYRSLHSNPKFLIDSKPEDKDKITSFLGDYRASQGKKKEEEIRAMNQVMRPLWRLLVSLDERIEGLSLDHRLTRSVARLPPEFPRDPEQSALAKPSSPHKTFGGHLISFRLGSGIASDASASGGVEEAKGEELEGPRGPNPSVVYRSLVPQTFASREAFRHWEPSSLALIAAPLIFPEHRGDQTLDLTWSQLEDPSVALMAYYQSRYDLALRIGPFVRDHKALRHALAHALLIPEMTSSAVAEKISTVDPQKMPPVDVTHWVEALRQAQAIGKEKGTLNTLFEKRLRWLSYMGGEASETATAARVALLSEIYELANVLGKEIPSLMVAQKMRNALWHMGEIDSREAHSGGEIYTKEEERHLRESWLKTESWAVDHGSSVLAGPP